MPSLKGLNTWFEYEVSLTILVAVLVIVFWGLNRLVTSLGLGEYLLSLPLTSPKFALAFTTVGLGILLLLVGLAGRYS